MSDDKCYFCGGNANTKEHVPPKCLFPEKKDTKSNTDYRKNLITVASCDEHNNDYAKDDEFLMVCLAGLLGNNSIGYEHQQGKVTRALKRRSGKLLDTALKNRKPILIKNKNKFTVMIKSTPDMDRLSKALEKIGYGVYCHHNGKSFKGKVQLFSAFLVSEDKNNNYKVFKKMIIDRASKELAKKEELGENRDVFSYCFAEPDINGVLTLRVKFYGGIEVYYAFAPIDFSLESDFMKLSLEAGWKTHIHADGKVYSFNTS